MKFLRSKIAILFILIVTSLCLVSVGISIRITTTILKRQNQIVKDIPAAESGLVKADSKIVNITKLKNQVFYFNGEELEGINAFSADKKEFFVPLDTIFDKIGVKYKYYSPDELFEATVNGKKLIIKLGENNYSFGGKSMKINSAPVTAKDHFLAPVELLNGFDGFKCDVYGEKETVFLSYYSGYTPASYSVKILRYLNNIANITDISGQKVYWSGQAKSEGPNRYEFSGNGSACIIRTDGKVYVYNSNNSTKPVAVDADPSATLSDDGRYLYWVDSIKQTSYVYDITNRTIKKLGDYFFRAKADSSGYLMYGGYILSDYKQTNSYKRVSLTDVSKQDNYTFIERYGREILKGSVEFSPDRKKVLHYEADKGYYIADIDGKNLVFLGDFPGTQAEWINNNRISIYNDKLSNLFDRNGRNKTVSGDRWRKVGQTLGGTVFFTRGNTLNYELNGTERKIVDLPWQSNFVYAPYAKGPYLVASGGNDDGVYLLNGKTTIKVASNSLILKGYTEGEQYFPDYEGTISGSPDKTKAIVLTNENGFVSLNIINFVTGVIKKVVLNYLVEDNVEADNINLKWVSNDKLYVYAKDSSWAIDLKGDTKVYEIGEQDGSTIEGVLPSAN